MSDHLLCTRLIAWYGISRVDSTGNYHVFAYLVPYDGSNPGRYPNGMSHMVYPPVMLRATRRAQMGLWQGTPSWSMIFQAWHSRYSKPTLPGTDWHQDGRSSEGRSGGISWMTACWVTYFTTFMYIHSYMSCWRLLDYDLWFNQNMYISVTD